MRGDRALIVILAIIAVMVLVLVFDGDGRIGSLPADDFASVGYLGAIAAVLGLGVLASARADLPAALKAAGVWIGGFRLLIALYAYRGEFREVGDRMLAEIVPGHAISVAGSDGRTVMVARGDDNHFHIDADVDGRTVGFLVDTGASTVAIDRGTAAALGFDVSEAAFTDRVQTANGTARSAPIVIPSVRVGGIERRNVRAAVMDAGGDGINLLGMSFLGTLSSFDFQGERLVLTD